MRITAMVMIMLLATLGVQAQGINGGRARTFIQRYDKDGDGQLSREEVEGMPAALRERIRAARGRRQQQAALDAQSSATAVSVPDAKRLEAARKYMEETGGQALVVMHEGKVIAEHYANGGGPRRPQALASGSKSFVGTAAAAMIQDGLLKLEERAGDTLGEWKNDPRKSKITVFQLLHLCSGLDPGVSPLKNGGKRIDWAEALAAPLLAEPGEKFLYGPQSFLAFGALAQRKLKEKTGETFEAYLKRRVLDPLGVRVIWLKSPAGDTFLPGGALMTARDWAAFGEFMRLEGKRAGQQIIARECLALCRQNDPTNPAYGLTWWLKRPVPPRLRLTIPTLMGDMGEVANSPWVPGDLFMAAGAGKQRLYVIPSLGLVAVRQGPVSGGERFKDTEFLRLLLVNGR